MTTLPLSWEFGVPAPYTRSRWLPFSRTHWITGVGFTAATTGESIRNFFLHKKSFVIRGCSATLLEQFPAKRKIYTFQTGVHGWVRPEKFKIRKQLAELERRALRFGSVTEIFDPDQQHEAWNELWKNSVHGQKYKLRHLFHTGLNKNIRLFVFKSQYADDWMGAITLSRNSRHIWHVESMVRHKSAPVGVMDALLIQIIRSLGNDAIEKLSLGEVPFVKGSSPGIYHGLFALAGRILNPVYGYHGLYRFKDKYVQHWEPVYLISDRPIGLCVLMDMFRVSGTSKLALQSVNRLVSQCASLILMN